MRGIRHRDREPLVVARVRAGGVPRVAEEYVARCARALDHELGGILRVVGVDAFRRDVRPTLPRAGERAGFWIRFKWGPLRRKYTLCLM
jgi:hypothetical protein